MNEIKTTIEEILNISIWEKASPDQSAIFITTGVYQDFRIPKGAKNWPDKGKHLWVAGTRADPFYTRKEIIEMINKEKGKPMDYSNMENGGYQDHTLDQMMWVTELLKKNDVNHLILTTAAYHISRCVLTCLQTMKKQSIENIVISPIPIYQGPSLDSEEFRGEVFRISKYREKGDVASSEVWRNYVNWRNDFTK